MARVVRAGSEGSRQLESTASLFLPLIFGTDECGNAVASVTVPTSIQGMLVAGSHFRHALSGRAACSHSLRPSWPQERARRRSFWTSNLSKPVQSYVSTSSDPFVNLSLEHRLLESTAPSSIVLMFYTNRPSIVIGRNQNPWYETNLAAVEPQLRDGTLSLVRRRSGGGTVYHDSGNINWTVICPSKSFSRDKHAAMVVRALRSPSCNVARARVNKRHDIVLDQGTRERDGMTAESEYETPWTDHGDAAPRPLKCSGSAFKITRHRALHHGTCLLRSSGLAKMGTLLSSPGKAYIQAKGVESVSSPVGNTELPHSTFMAAVREQFESLYNDGRPLAHMHVSEDEALADALVQKGHDELRSPGWMFAQTPRFNFTAQTSEVPDLKDLGPLTVHVEVEKGRVKRLATWRDESDGALGADSVIHDTEGDWPMYDGSWAWSERLAQLDDIGHDDSKSGQSTSQRLGIWLQHVFPSVKAS